jgi:hypothetical protein
MENNFTNRRFIEWNLIYTGRLLVKKFKESNVNVNVIIVRASHFHLKSYAKYF